MTRDLNVALIEIVNAVHNLQSSLDNNASHIFWLDIAALGNAIDDYEDAVVVDPRTEGHS